MLQRSLPKVPKDLDLLSTMNLSISLHFPLETSSMCLPTHRKCLPIGSRTSRLPACPSDLDYILTGEEERHPEPDSDMYEEFTGNRARNYRNSIARSRFLYKILTHSVQLSTSPDKSTAQAKLREFANYQEKEAWDALNVLHLKVTPPAEQANLSADANEHQAEAL